MRRGFLGLLGVAALAAGVGAPSPAAPIAQQAVQATATGTNAPATQAPSASRVMQDINPFLVYKMSVPRNDRIWNGIAKRGNRRGRSRWNYNR